MKNYLLAVLLFGWNTLLPCFRMVVHPFARRTEVLHMGLTYAPTVQAAVKKWIFYNLRVSAETYESSAETIPEMMRDIINCLLIQAGIVNPVAPPDIEVNEHIAAVVFTNPSLLSGNLSQVMLLMEKHANQLVDDSLVGLNLPLEDKLEHACQIILPRLQVYDGKEQHRTFPGVLLATRRRKPFFPDTTKPVTLNDIVDNSIKPHEITGQIQGWPFKNFKEFVEEINRPPDPATMANLTFHFTVADFKVLELRPVETDPDDDNEYEDKFFTMIGGRNRVMAPSVSQEKVNNINCQLTRLQRWRDFLAQAPSSTPSPFIDSYRWMQVIRTRHSFMATMARQDPKGMLDAITDLQTVYIPLIDKWMYRLRDQFKYGNAELQAEPNVADIAKTFRVRTDLITLQKLPVNMAFLTFTGAVLHPADENQPGLLDDKVFVNAIDSRRKFQASLNLQYEDILADVIHWMRHTQQVMQYAYEYGYQHITLPYHRINWVTVSKTSRGDWVMRDLWDAVHKWQHCTSPLREPLTLQPAELKQFRKPEHMSQFFSFLRELNTFARAQSRRQQCSVRDVFRHLSRAMDDSAQWWLDALDQTGLEDNFSERYEGPMRENGVNYRLPPKTYVQVMDEMLLQTGDRSTDLPSKILRSDKYMLAQYHNASKWYRDKYRATFATVDRLQQLLPWQQRDPPVNARAMLTTNTYNELHSMSKRDKVISVHIQNTLLFNKRNDASSTVNRTKAEEDEGDALLFVLPRAYKEITTTNAEYLGFCNLVSKIDRQLSLYDERLVALPLHPMMTLQSVQETDYARRCPYPAILIYRTTTNSTVATAVTNS